MVATMSRIGPERGRSISAASSALGLPWDGSPSVSGSSSYAVSCAASENP